MARPLPPRLLPNRDTEYQVHTGTLPSGDDAYSALVKVPRSLVEEKTRLVRSATGEEKVSSARVFLNAEHVVTEESLVTVFADGPRKRTAKVISVDYYEDPKTYAYTILNLE